MVNTVCLQKFPIEIQLKCIPKVRNGLIQLIKIGKSMVKEISWTLDNLIKKNSMDFGHTIWKIPDIICMTIEFQ